MRSGAVRPPPFAAPGDTVPMSSSNRPRARSAPSPRRKLDAVQELLDADAFSRIRSPSELTDLVREESQATERPYAALLHRLMGLDPEVEEALAKKVWLTAVEHKRSLAQLLGRDVLLRVAMLDLLSTMPELASIRQPVMLSRKLLRRALRETTTDALTGLMRRDEFLPIVSHELRQRYKTPPVLAYMDVDGLKALNDRRGHVAGDRVLASVGQVMTTVGRKGDAFARIGGDEFAVLLLDCGLTKARECVARIRTSLRESLEYDVDLAVGLAVARPGESAASLMDRADRAMYAVKRRRKQRPQESTTDGAAALVFVTDPAALFEVHSTLASVGRVVVPVDDDVVASSLLRLMQPSLVVVDNGPRAQRWMLESIGSAAERTWVRVLELGDPPQQPIARELLIRRPIGAGAASRLLRSAAGRARPPSPLLCSPAEGALLTRAIGAVLAGTDVNRSRIYERLEVDVVRRLLGT